MGRPVGKLLFSRTKMGQKILPKIDTLTQSCYLGKAFTWSQLIRLLHRSTYSFPPAVHVSLFSGSKTSCDYGFKRNRNLNFIANVNSAVRLPLRVFRGCSQGKNSEIPCLPHSDVGLLELPSGHKEDTRQSFGVGEFRHVGIPRRKLSFWAQMLKGRTGLRNVKV